MTEKDCIEYTRSSVRGYGRIYVPEERKARLAHRVTWERSNGPVPDGMCVLHRCDNRACVNIDHLFLGSYADNAADMVEKERQARGEKNGHAKLTDAAVRALREAYGAGGRSQRAIAQEFGVSLATAQAAIHRRTWRHV